METVIYTYSLTTGGTYQVVSTGSGTYDVKTIQIN